MIAIWRVYNIGVRKIRTPREDPHGALSLLYLFLTPLPAAIDRPPRGAVSVQPTAYEFILEQTMAGGTASGR